MRSTLEKTGTSAVSYYTEPRSREEPPLLIIWGPGDRHTLPLQNRGGGLSKSLTGVVPPERGEHKAGEPTWQRESSSQKQRGPGVGGKHGALAPHIEEQTGRGPENGRKFF